MSWLLNILFLAIVLFFQNCRCKDDPRTYSEYELSDIVRNFDIKFAEIEAKLEKQTTLNKEFEKKIRFQDDLIRTLTKRFQTQTTKILKCEKQVKENSDFIKPSFHSQGEYHRNKNTTKGRDRKQTSSTDELLQKSSPKLFAALNDKSSPSAKHNKRQARQTGECVAFSAYLDRNVTDLGPDHTIQHGGIVLNEGGAYNSHTGVFTTPTSGIYLFTYAVENFADHRIWVKIVVDGQLRSSVILHPYPNYRTMGSNSVILRLAAGESVWMAIDASESGDSLKGSSAIRATTFSGVLLC